MTDSAPSRFLHGVNQRRSRDGLRECSIVSPREAGGFLACIYLAPGFRDAATVAVWFHALGARGVIIDYTLYSDVDGDRDGLTNGVQAWTVYFDCAATEAAEAMT